MDTIYFKEAKDSYNSVFDVINHYFSIAGDNVNPATYWASSNELQCFARKNISFDDLLLMCQHYIPESKIEDVVNAIYQFNKDKDEGMIVCIHCGGIKRFVIITSRHDKETLTNYDRQFGFLPSDIHTRINGYAQNSQWDIIELRAMIIK